MDTFSNDIKYDPRMDKLTSHNTTLAKNTGQVSTERLQSTIPVELDNIIDYSNQIPKKVILSSNNPSSRQNVTDRV